jgi:hypothetical protein
MFEKQTVALVGLTAVILVLTGAAVGSAPSSPMLGVVAPVIIPALLTWYLLMILAYGGRIIEILAAFLVLRPLKETRQTQSMLATVLAWVIVIALAVVIIRPEIMQSLAGAFQQAAEVFSSSANVLSQTNQAGVESNPSPSNVVLYYYAILVFGAILVVSFSLFLGGLRKAYTEIRAQSGEHRLREDVLGVVKSTRAKLEARDRYPDAIIECYQQMCEILSRRGHEIGPAQTAREFAEHVSGKLDLATDLVKGLTFLFEEARYSDHQIGDEKRSIALNYLYSLEHALVGDGVKI